MAIPMPIVQDIRRLDRQGLSRAQIARRLHVDRGDRLDSPAAEVLTAPATHAPPWSCPHENSNSASLYSLQGRYLFSDALPPMVICLTVMVVVTRFEFRMPLFIGLSLFTFDLYQWHIVLLRVLAP